MREPHSGQVLGNSKGGCSGSPETDRGRPLFGNDGHHFGNHVAGPAHDHGIADADVLAPHFVLVVQRGIGDRHPADEYRLQARHRRDRPGAAHLYVNAQYFGQRFLGRKFVRHRKAGRARHEAELGLPIEAIDFVHHAVDVVRQA